MIRLSPTEYGNILPMNGSLRISRSQNIEFKMSRKASGTTLVHLPFVSNERGCDFKQGTAQVMVTLQSQGPVAFSVLCSAEREQMRSAQVLFLCHLSANTNHPCSL